MRLLLVYYHFEVCGGRYYLDAFKSLGHDVRHIGQQMSVKDAWGLQTPVPEKYAHVPDGLSTPNGFVDYWDDWTPDLILVCDSMVAGMPYHHPKYKGVPLAVIAIDNHVRDYDGDWAHQFLAHYHGPAYPVDPARKDHSWLPCASDPMFTPSPIPWSEREYDVACVGVMYPRRVEVINALRAAGLKVFAATGLLYEEYRDAYHNARISLCVSAAGDVAQRIFETGRMGCAILTDPLLDFADEYTNQSLHIYGRATYANPSEAALLARDLLGQPQAAFEVGMLRPHDTSMTQGEQAAQQMVVYCAPHTWEARAQVIVDWFEREYGKAEAVEKPIKSKLPPGFYRDTMEEMADIQMINKQVAEALVDIALNDVSVDEAIEAVRHPTVSSVDVGEVYALAPDDKPVQFSKEQLQETIAALEQGKNEPASLQPDILYTRPEVTGGITAQQAMDNMQEFVDTLQDRNQYPIPETVEVVYSSSKPYLNLGCGRTHLPGERPAGHELVDASVYAYPEWVNVDKVEGVGADKVFDLFTYPWPLEDNSFDGAVLGHIIEHIPHEIKLADLSFDAEQGKQVREFISSGKVVSTDLEKRTKELSHLQDGFYAFFAELYRVLTPGAIAHIISPFAWSEGAITDPTHTRMITVQTFTHGLSPAQYTGTFKYNIDCNFEMVGHMYRYTEFAKPYMDDPAMLNQAIFTRINMIYDLYAQLKVVK